MSLLTNRTFTSDDIIKNRFIRKVFGETAKDIDSAQKKIMSARGFEKSEWFSGREFSVTDNSMDMKVLLKHRFVDMKTRNSASGKHSKKSHPVYNKIIWGNYNNVVREMAFGFTEAIKEELRNINDI
jgi:hypothetical protein